MVELGDSEAGRFMRFRALLFTCAAATLAACAGAQGITGTILIKRKLTKPRVTAPVSVYQRGAAVQLGKDAAEDPLVYERSRVVVYLEGVSSAASNSPEAAVEVQQLDRRFMPDLVVVPVGSTVSFPNMDPIFHNIYSLSKAKTFDLGSYDKGETRKVMFPKPGIVDVYCHLHPNMAATIVVTPNRWYARPDASGRYSIPDVPPGQYTLVAWHRSAGFFRKTIVVDKDHNSVADFFIPLDADSNQDAMAKQGPMQMGESR
jgi:plastocyanin